MYVNNQRFQRPISLSLACNDDNVNIYNGYYNKYISTIEIDIIYKY